MASTNKTTNYELSQFIETDRPAWLTDYNGDMRTIDRIMKAISDMASGASGSVSELADRMSTAEGNISTNTNDISTLDARADSLEAQAQSTAGTIANIQTEQTAQNLGIEAATELGYNLARPYDSASTYAVGDYVLFQNTLYKCITAVPVGEAFMPAKWLAIKAMDEMNTGGYTLPIASASQLGGVKVGNGLSIDPLTGILSASGNNTEVTTLNSNNFTITIKENPKPTITTNYFESAASSTNAATMSNLSVRLGANPWGTNKIIKIGKFVILYTFLSMSFDPINLTKGSLLNFSLYLTFNSPIIDFTKFASNRDFGYYAGNHFQCQYNNGVHFESQNKIFDPSLTSISSAGLHFTLIGVLND